MRRYEVMKEDAILGPFTIEEIAEFVRAGLILKRDYAYDVADPDKFRSVAFFLKRHGREVSVEHKGNLFSQLRDIGGELILPHSTFTKEPWERENRLPVLALVGLGLSVILAIAPFLNTYLIFYGISLYFSAIWGLFFYYLFRTEQVSWKTTIVLFVATQVFMNVFFIVVGVGRLNPFEGWYENENPAVALFACILGIGVPEEFVKLLPVGLIVYFASNVLKPQTVAFYGLISGIAFGVYEGVNYQLGPNFQMLVESEDVVEGYIYSYVSNIARLTGLPFLHAVWSGIASYFLAFAFLYPRYRISLCVLAVVVPAVIHGVYDYLCFNVALSLATIPVVVASVVLLMVYLGKRYDFHSRLAD